MERGRRVGGNIGEEKEKERQGECEERKTKKNKKGEREREMTTKKNEKMRCRDCCKEVGRNLKNLVWFSFVSTACKDTWTVFN